MGVLEPRIVESGYLLRWLKRSLALLGVNFHVWFALALAFSALCWCFSEWLLVLMPLGVLFTFFSVEMAALSNRRLTSLVDVGQALRQAGLEAAKEVWRVKTRLLSIFVLILAVQILYLLLVYVVSPVKFDALAQPPAPKDYSALSTWVFAGSPLGLAATAMFMGSLVLDSGSPFGFVRYPLRRAFGLSPEWADFLRDRAFNRNPVTGMVANVGEFLLLIIVQVLLPVLAPLVLCLLPAIHFVVYKELFDPEGLPEEVTETEELPAAIQPARIRS